MERSRGKNSQKGIPANLPIETAQKVWTWCWHGDLKCSYVASIRSMLEYSCQVFHYGFPQYLSDVIERIQKRALCIIYPQLSYQQWRS
jgi:hypothetical protein